VERDNEQNGIECLRGSAEYLRNVRFWLGAEVHIFLLSGDCTIEIAFCRYHILWHQY
jgi:hypothetical protein